MRATVDTWPRPAANWRRHPQWLLGSIFLCSLALGVALWVWPAQRALLREQAEAGRLVREGATRAASPLPEAPEPEVVPSVDSAALWAGVAAAVERGGLRLERLVAAPLATRGEGVAAVLRLSAAGGYNAVAELFLHLGALPWPVAPRWFHLAPAESTATPEMLRLQAELVVCCELSSN